MKPKYWLPLGALVLGASATAACTSDFTSCIETRTCPLGGAGGEAGDTSEASATAGNVGKGGSHSSAGAPGKGDAGQEDHAAGSGGEAGAILPEECSADLDLKSDPKNCGVCGHDCLGGECDLGRCQPVAITPMQIHTSDIATDGTYVFWSGANPGDKTYYVARRRIDRADEVKVIAPNEPRVEGLTASATAVYWLGAGQVRECISPDCAMGPTNVEPTTASCFKIHYSSNGSTPALYWTCQTQYAQNNGSFWSAATSASAPVHIQPQSANPTGLTSDADSVYWVNASGFNSESNLDPDGAVWRLKLSNGATTKLVSGLTGQMGNVAVGGGKIYFDGVDNTISSVPLPNGALKPTKVADGSVVGGMVADTQALYWSDYASGAIARCPHSGCVTPEVVALGQTHPLRLTQDATSIYWISNYDDGAPIRRLAK